MNKCPDTSQLQSMLDGSVTSDDLGSIARHVGDCQACQEKYEELAGSFAMPVDCAAVAGDHQCLEPALQRVMESLRAEGPSPGRSTDTLPVDAPSGDTKREGVDLSFLSPSGHPGSCGRLGMYEITGVVGQGGMGVVLKALDPELQRYVAIKVLHANLASNATARKRFKGEARKAAALSHDHVVTIHRVDEANGVPFIVMKYVAGRTLEERIKRDGALKLREILRIGMQTAAGLAAAHAQGIVHRDVKPANILLENGVERVEITDFGLARAMDDVQITTEGVVAGTPEFMSPEQANGQDLDQRSDLFSLGSVLYCMCTGRSPFRGSTMVHAMRRVEEDTPRPIQKLNPDIPDWLVEIIDRLLEKSPEDRFQTADEVVDLLGGHLAHLQQPAVSPKPGILRHGANRPLMKHAKRWWTFGGIAVLAALAITLGVAGSQFNQPKTVPRDLNTDVLIGIEMLRSRRFDDAQRSFQKALKEPNLDRASRALCLRYMGFLENKVELVQQAIELDDSEQGRAQAMSLLGFLQIQAGDLQSAHDNFKAALALSNGSPDAVMLPELPIVGLAISKRLLQPETDNAGLVKVARQQAEKSLKHPQLLRWLEEAYYWTRHGQPEVADFVVQIAWVPQGVDGINRMKSQGAASWARGDHDLALYIESRCHEAYAETSQHWNACMRLVSPARWHAQAGDYQQAISYYKRALEYAAMNPGFSEYATLWVKQELARLLDHVGRKEEANPLFADVATKLLPRLRNGQYLWDKANNGFTDWAIYCRCVLGAGAETLDDDMAREFNEKMPAQASRESDPALAASVAAHVESFRDLDLAVAHYRDVHIAHPQFYQYTDYLTRRLCMKLVDAGRSEDAETLLEFRINKRDQQVAKSGQLEISRWFPRVELAKLLISEGRELERARKLLTESRKGLAKPPFEKSDLVQEIDSLMSALD